jgi:hypothetical protein
MAIGISGPQEDARHVMAHGECFLAPGLPVKTAQEKSGIDHATEGIRLLGDDVRTYSSEKQVKMKRRNSPSSTLPRTIAGDLQLHVPPERVRTFYQRKGYGDLDHRRPIQKPAWLTRSDGEILLASNAELRGFANYDRLATHVKQTLTTLEYIWQGSLLKTLATKHKTSVSTMVKKLRQGRGSVYRDHVQGQARHLKLYALKDLKKIPKNGTMVDAQPTTARSTRSRTEIVQRFEAQTCAYCGKDEGYFEGHHVRKLKDLHGKERGQHVMASMQRKTLVVCNVCHDVVHQGTLPDWRYQAMERRAGFHASGTSGSGGG